MDQQPFDLASMRSMAFAASGNFGKGAAPGNASLAAAGGGGGGGKGRGVRFWATVEGVTKTTLLLLAGAGVGGLLFPEASAAGAQTKFVAERARGREGADMVDLLLQKIDIDNKNVGRGKSSTPYDLDLSNSDDEFGDATANPPSIKASATKVAGSGGVVGGGGGDDTVEMEGWEDLSVDDDATPTVLDGFLSYMDYVVGWSHSLSSMVVPSWVGVGGQAACVPAIFLAVLVRLAVASSFSVLRVGLGLPAFPSAVGKSKPGMIMGMVLATMPMLGKVLAFGGMIKSVFADTTLVVAGTVLTLTVCLGWEEDSGPRTAANSVLGMFGLLTSGGDNRLKEL